MAEWRETPHLVAQMGEGAKTNQNNLKGKAGTNAENVMGGGGVLFLLTALQNFGFKSEAEE